MDAQPEILGIIAGNRTLPLELARQARAMGVGRLVAVAFESETDPSLAALVDEVEWIRVGQLGKLIKAFRKHGVTRCVMAGQISPKRLFDFRPDLRALSLLMRVKEKNAHTLFGAVVEELAREGIEVVEGTPWLKPLMPGAGFHWGTPLTAAQREDVAFGYRMVQEITRLEIGQTVVVKNGAVLAVEAFEGTDACLRRGGEMAGSSGGAVAVKAARARHDMRFDIPCVGKQTLEICVASGIAALAVEAGKTLFLDLAEIEDWMQRQPMAVVTVGD